MRSYMTGVVAVALGLAVVAAAQAGGRGNSGGSRGSSFRTASYRSSSTRFITHDVRHNTGNYSNKSFKDYNLKYGTKFGYGFLYKGRYHKHWSCRYWCGTYGCWYYYDPCCRCYYYWYGADSCWYPVSYISTCRPVSGEAVSEVNEEIPEVPAPVNESGPVVTSGPSKTEKITKTASIKADSEEK